MKFKPAKSANMSSYKGCFTAYYSELVEMFGRPNSGPNADLDKVTCEWILEFEDGEIATIYDWLNNRTPMGMAEWHIGGYSELAAQHVLDVVNFNRNKLVKFIRAGQ